MIDINLLPKRDLLSQAERRWQNNLLLVVAALGLVVAVGAAVVFGLEGWAAGQMARLGGQRAELLAQFESNTPKLEMLLALKDKIAGIKRVQAVRPSLSLAVAREQQLLVDGVTTTRMTVNVDGSMSFAVLVRDVQALSDYLAKLDSDEAREFFKMLTVNELQLAKDGSFAFSVVAQFDKEKLLAGGL